MPNIDVSSIEGFEGMTAEQKVEALLKVEIPEAVDLTGFVKKSVFDAKASEAAELSKKLKGKMTEDELADAERQRIQAENDQKYSDLETKYNDLVKKSTIAEYTTKYLELGYEAKLAAETAKAMVDGDMTKVFENGEKHKANMEKKIKEDLINKTPKPGGAGGKEDGDGEDSAVAKAKELAKSRNGDGKAYADIMKNYKH